MSGDGRAPVAIIGAGVAGLSCAAAIANAVTKELLEKTENGRTQKGKETRRKRKTTKQCEYVRR